MSEHARAWCLILNIPEIPKGYVVHHLDENKRNNDINNLSLMSITAHNRIHSHEAWNKGITAETSDVWKNAVIKQRQGREENYLEKAKESYEIYNTGMTQLEVAMEQGVSRATISLRIKKYTNYLKEKND